MLSQQDDDDKWHPVAFLSRALSPVKHNYEIDNIEMLAIIRALEEWWHYLEGAQHPIEIWPDHKNLKYFHVAQKLNQCQAHWSLYLSQCDFTLCHKPGKSMGKPDALSRCANHSSGQNDNDNMTLLSADQFSILALTALDLVGEECDILTDVCCSLCDDAQEESIAKAACELRKD